MCSCWGRAIWTRNFGLCVAHCIWFNLNKSVMKLNNMQFDTGKLILWFKLLSIGKNTLLKPWGPLINGIFDYILLCVDPDGDYYIASIGWEVKHKLQLSSGGAETVYGLSGHHLHYFVANLSGLTFAKFYTNRFGFKEDMAKNILVCFFMGHSVYCKF